MGRALAARLMTHPLYSLGPVLGSSATVGKPLTDVWKAKEKALEDHYGVGFEGITLAWYRDGRDSVAPHGDRIGRLCDDTVGATVAVGAPRRFLRHPAGGGRSLSFSPGWGDLLVMGGACQQTHVHGVPKRRKKDEGAPGRRTAPSRTGSLACAARRRTTRSASRCPPRASGPRSAARS